MRVNIFLYNGTLSSNEKGWSSDIYIGSPTAYEKL